MTPSNVLDVILSLTTSLAPLGVMSAAGIAIYFIAQGVFRPGGSARSGSVVAASARHRGPLLTLFLLGWLAIAWTAPVAIRRGVGLEVLLAIAVASVAIGCLLVRDIARLSKIRGVLRGLVRMPDGPPLLVREELDLGVGDERWISGAELHGPYRGAVHQRAVVGSVPATLRRLAGVVLVDVALIGAWAVFVGVMVQPPRGCGFDTTRTSARTLRSAAELWRAEHPVGECPTAATLVQDHLVDRSSILTDAWGGPYTIGCAEDETYVFSRGPDGVDDRGYGDDIRVPDVRRWSQP